MNYEKFSFNYFSPNLNFIYAQVGVGTTTPQSTLDVNGNVSFKVVNLNG